MRAYVSGQAGAAVVLGRKPQVRILDEPPRDAWSEGDALRVFDGCHDVKEVTFNSAPELDKILESAWAKDRALRIFLLLLDPLELDADLVEYADCIENLLKVGNTREFLENRLFSTPLPNLIELNKILRATTDAPITGAIFQQVLSAQELIAKVRSAFDVVSLSNFLGDEDTKESLRRSLAAAGYFRRVVIALGAQESLDFIKLNAASEHRAHGAAISQWLAGLQSNLPRVPKRLRAQSGESEEEFDDDSHDERRLYPSRQAYEQVVAQQKGIVERLKSRDLDGARRLTVELVRSQEANSSSEQTAKSLCKLAQQAKIQEIPELQLEWAEWATRVNPADPMTFGHFADALLGAGRYEEAERAFAAVESAGDAPFAATGRARILKAMGRPFDARKKYLEAASAIGDLPSAEFARTGAAECLREIGDPTQALEEYERLTHEYPLSSTAWAGLASTLMDLGRLDEAIAVFGKAATNDSSPVARCGRANAFKIVGNFDQAIKLYNEVLADFPNNHGALCGRAEVFRARGQKVSALHAYDVAIKRSPQSPIPLSGKATLLRELQRYEDAISLLDSARSAFPFEPSFDVILASVFRAQGKFADALIVLDTAIGKFPFDAAARIMRASVLHRIGREEEALAAYNNILSDRPHMSGAILGKASVLIKLKQYDEADKILVVARPRTQTEWKRYILRAYVVEAQVGIGAAGSWLERGLRNCQFAAERRALRDSLAALELKRHRYREARRLVESAPNEVSNVVALHVLAASHRPGLAKRHLAEIRQSHFPADIIELAEEIARRHKLVDAAPRHSAKWLADVERSYILAEVA